LQIELQIADPDIFSKVVVRTGPIPEQNHRHGKLNVYWVGRPSLKSSCPKFHVTFDAQIQFSETRISKTLSLNSYETFCKRLQTTTKNIGYAPPLPSANSSRLNSYETGCNRLQPT
jgi:hypothetical protein